MKLDDWSMKKYKSRQKIQHNASSPLAIRSNTTVVPKLVLEPEILAVVPEPPLPIPYKLSPSVPVPQEILAQSSNEARNYAHETQALHLTFSEGFQSSPTGPVVNSSLMFFSTRSPTESLFMLSNFPAMAPLGLETLLRNWKPNSQHLSCALEFLQQREFCHTIVGVNWTRWTDRDETLFDLVEDLESEQERSVLVSELLKADLRFRCKLARRSAEWAGAWRRACQESKWVNVKKHLRRMDAPSKLRTAAFDVLAVFHRGTLG